MAILGIIFLAIGLIALIATCITNPEETLMILSEFLLGMFALFGILCICEGTYPKKTEFKYPISEYTLEYEVITRGEQIDSTYVISKIIN